MANGDLNIGNVTSGSIQTSIEDQLICSWTIPENTTARIEVFCLVQRIDNLTKSSFSIIATCKRESSMASISSGPTIFRTRGNGTVIGVILATNTNDIIVKTTSATGNEFRITCFMRMYSVGI